MTRPPISDRDGGDGTHRLLGELIGSVKGMQGALEEQKRDQIRTDDRLTNALSAFRDAQATRDSANREAQYQQTQVIQNGIDQLKRQVIGLDEKATTQDRKTTEVTEKVATLHERVEELNAAGGEIKTWQGNAVRYIGWAVAILAIIWASVVKPLVEHGIQAYFKG